jgi:hypothetical protein
MNKNVSIVVIDTRPYRKIAQDNWGLSNEQMKGMHVHHRIPVSKGGTNDPTNLYVCSPSFHRWVWHGGEIWVEWANEGAKRAHAKRDELGRSINGIKNAERLNLEKDEFGRSVNAIKASRKAHEKRDELGKSINARRASQKAHQEKDEFGRSIVGVRNGERLHREKDDQGKSVVAMRSHAEKDEFGRSVLAVENAKKVHAERDEFGRSLHAMKNNSQIWESTIDGFRSNAGGVATHNKAKGWDPNARVKIS